MEDNSVFYYKLAYPGVYNDAEDQDTVFWNDPKFNIEWPCQNPLLSKRDTP
jgi:dTDP-4-dehydrorhamnose 3,5-epimerase